MAEPFNYSVDIPNPGDAFLKGFKTAEEIRGIQVKRAEEKRALDAQIAMQNDLGNLYKNPTIQGINQVMAKYPAIADKFKPLLESMNEQQKGSRIQQANNVFMPLIQGRRDIALEQLKLNEESAKNSGDAASANSMKLMRELVESEDTGQAGDNAVIASVGSFLAAAMGEKEFAKTYGTIMEQKRAEAKAPAELKEAEAKAEKAAIGARFAEAEIVADLEKKGWDIKKIQSDSEVSKQNAKIALMNAQIARETNQLKREELGIKVEEARTKRDEHVREKAAEAEGSLAKIDNMLTTIDRAQATSKWTIKTAAGPVASKIPTVNPDVADFEELVNTMGSQAFLAQVAQLKGMGALSDAEGKKLQSAFQNFSLRQSPDRLMENISEAQRMLRKARETVAKKYGVPSNAPKSEQPTQSRNVTVDY